MSLDAVNLPQKLSLFAEHWSPRTVSTVNDYEVKVVKVQGEFVWHQHDDTDEFFLVLDGELTIDLPEGRSVVLGPLETATVPRGTPHRPRAEVETSIVLLEPAGVVNTGDAGGPLTAPQQSV